MRCRLLSAALAATLAFGCPTLASAQAHFSAEILLQQEGLGGVRLSPDGAWIAVERQARYDSAPAYRFAQYTSRLLTQIDIFDARQGVKTISLGSEDRTAGYITGPFSPNGRRMVVYRLTLERWSLGVLTLETGAVTWLPYTPEETQFGRTTAWVDADTLLLITRPDESLPLLFRVGHQAQDRVTDLWAKTASGRSPGSVYLPSGALRDTRAQAAPLALIQLDLDTGVSRELTRGALYDLILSPNGRKAAVMAEEEDLQPAPGTALRVGDSMRRRSMRLVDLEAGTTVRVAPAADFAPYFAAWSPTSDRLLAFTRPVGAAGFETTGRYGVIDLDGKIVDLARADFPPSPERSLWGEPVALGGWFGDQPLLRLDDPINGPRWRTTDGRIDQPALPGDRLVRWDGTPRLKRAGALVALDAREPLEGVATQLGDRRDMGNRADWTPDNSDVASLLRGSCLHTPEHDAPICVTSLAPDERVLAASAQAEVIVTRQSRTDGSASIQLHGRHEVRELVTVNETRGDLRWGEVIETPHQGPGGEALKSWLLLPPDLAPGQRPPLVVDVYVGRTDNSPPALLGRGSSRLQNNPAVIAAAGYAVLYISLPNPPTGRYDGAELARRILEVVDSAPIAQRVETSRLALMGHSYGAYNVLLAAPESPRFAAVIASNGFADLTTAFNLPLLYRTGPDEGVPIGTLAGWAETGQGGIGRFPEDADLYVALSPLYQAETLRTPTLLIESDLDRPRYGAMFGALYRLNRDAALLTYFGEGHTVASPANVRDLHSHILEWLGRYLGPPARDPAFPVANPGLQDGGEQRLVAPLAPKQSVAIEVPS